MGIIAHAEDIDLGHLVEADTSSLRDELSKVDLGTIMTHVKFLADSPPALRERILQYVEDGEELHLTENERKKAKSHDVWLGSDDEGGWDGLSITARIVFQACLERAENDLRIRNPYRRGNKFHEFVEAILDRFGR